MKPTEEQTKLLEEMHAIYLYDEDDEEEDEDDEYEEEGL